MERDTLYKIRDNNADIMTQFPRIVLNNNNTDNKNFLLKFQAKSVNLDFINGIIYTKFNDL